MDATTQTTLTWIHELLDNTNGPPTEEIASTNIGGVQIEPEDTMQQLVDDLISSSDSNSSSQEDITPEGEIGEEESNSFYKPLPTSHNLPWPAILQYMRETESEAGKYFGLQTATPKTHHGKLKASKLLPTATGQNTPQVEKCQFCGEVITPLSLLPDNLEKVKEPKFCCDDLKEYIVLVALYTKRMQDHKLHSRPGPINLDSRRMEDKKTAQERALERMRRKQKWEDTNRKLILLQNSSVMAMSHQTKIIKFSLSSPHCMNTGWMTSSIESAGRTKKSRRLPLPTLPPLSPIVNTTEGEGEGEEKEQEDSGDTREMTKEERKLLEMNHYSTAGNQQLLSIVLPDKTGQTYYSSGNIAILRAKLSSSIYSYLLFNDSHKSGVIGYVDDLGRAWLKGDACPIKFVSTLKEGFLMESSGRTKLWSWNDHSSYSLYLPLTFRLNQHLSLRFNNHDDITISLSSQQKQQKYQIKRIVTKVSTKRSTFMEKEIQSYRIDLEKMKHRFDSHLKSFQQMVKLLAGEQRHKPLPLIGAHRNKPLPLLGEHRNKPLPQIEEVMPERKTKTVGTVTFQ